MREDFSRIWTFGFVGGNKYWLCGCTNKDNPFGEVAFGLKMEKIILYLQIQAQISFDLDELIQLHALLRL